MTTTNDKAFRRQPDKGDKKTGSLLPRVPACAPVRAGFRHSAPARGLNRLWRLGAILLFAVGTSACTGMYLGLTPDDEERTPLMSEDEVQAVADIHRITPTSVQRLQQEQQGAADIARARRDASTLLPEAGNYQYLVAPSDVLLVTVWNHPELNNPGGVTNEFTGRTVTSDGYFFYPYIGRVKAVGRTVSQIRSDMAARLTNYLTEPQVDVSVMRFRGRKSYVVGQVAKPGPIPVTDEPLFVTKLITEAGGLADDADLSRVILNRKGVVRELDLYALYYEGDLSQNVLLQDGDILNIPQRTQDKVFVLGEVASPQAQSLPWGRYSLTDAIGNAGGLNPTTSRASHVYVLRAVDSTRPEIWYLDASSPTALVLADGFELQPRDVVFVDAAAVTRWSRVINQVLPSARGILSESRAYGVR